jgi:outer membrane biosynthesis protein TonB
MSPEWKHRIPPIDVVVGADGRAKDVKLRSKSGVLTLDDLVMNYARNMHYEPALIDGFAVEAPYQLELR